MFKTTSYIFRQLFFVTLFLTAILTGAVWLTQSLRFIDVVVNKGLPITTFFYLIMFLLPDLVAIVLPAAFLISFLFVYNRLTADQELIVMRSLGMSHWQLAKPVLILSTTLMIVLYGINLYLLPHSFRSLKDMEHNIRGMMSQSLLQEGEFNSIKGLMVYVRAQRGPSEVSGIIIHDARDPEKPPFTITAERGAVFKDKDSLRLVLLNGARHAMDAKTGHPSRLDFDQYTVNLTQAQSPGPRYRKPYEYNLLELLQPGPEVQSAVERAKFRVQGHQRILSPLYVLAFSFIGLGALLSGEFNRRYRSRRILFAVCSCTILQILIISLINLSERLPMLLPVAYLIFIVIILSSFGFLMEWEVM